MTAVLTVPDLTAPTKPRRITISGRLLDTGLQVFVVRRPSVPMVELRLRVPFLSARATHPARAGLLSDAILTGTAVRDRTGLAAALGELGGDISVGLDADRLLLSASALSSRLPDLLALLAEVLTSASYPAREVAGERGRMLERITIARSQPGVIAGEALARRMAPGHPYGVTLPTSDAVAATTPAQLRKLHADLVRPAGSTLIMVGDLSPTRTLDTAERALAHWSGIPDPGRVPQVPPIATRPLLIVDRPGSVQTSLRFGGAALSRRDERFPALQLANLAFGGYFSSRWVENIREDKGYTYSPRSSLEHASLTSTFTASADVATEVTAAAVLETLYELGRMASMPITSAELESVRQYAIGTLALSTSTQSGLASTIAALVGSDLELDWLTTHPQRLAKVTLDDAAEVAAEFLAPRKLVGVAVGDAAAIRNPLSAIIDTE